MPDIFLELARNHRRTPPLLSTFSRKEAPRRTTSLSEETIQKKQSHRVAINLATSQAGKSSLPFLYDSLASSFQVRKSFFNDLDIDGNVTVVDLLYQQFYTGRRKEPTREEREFMRRLFRSETYVKKEYR